MFDYNYLIQLIDNQVEESPELEYKGAGALQKIDKKIMELTKDVSSFANSNGGVLIYGIAEDQSDKRFPGKIDPINCKEINKEWLEQIINSKIRPRIHDLKINVVSMPGDLDHVVYVLEIPKGNTAHQADDKRYYRRHNFMVEPMFDHEIRDLINRQKEPEIKVHLNIAKNLTYTFTPEDAPVPNEQKLESYSLMVAIENVGKIYAKYINLVITLPQRCLNGNMFDANFKGSTIIQLDNKVRDLVEPSDESRSLIFLSDHNKPKQYGPARHEPLLPKMRMSLRTIPISKYAFEPGNELSWIVYADNAEPQKGKMEFRDILKQNTFI